MAIIISVFYVAAAIVLDVIYQGFGGLQICYIFLYLFVAGISMTISYFIRFLMVASFKSASAAQSSKTALIQMFDGF